MNRRERQAAILRLVREQAISTQSELAEALHEDGFDVVQTTVSRDVAELGLVKVRAPSGRLVYAPPGASDADRLRALAAAIRRYGTGVEATGTSSSHDAVGLRQRARAGDRRGHASRRRGHGRGRQHDLRRRAEGASAAVLRDELLGHLLEGAA